MEFRATCISVERKLREELKLMTPAGSGPLRPNGALRALTPSQSKTPFNLFTDSRSCELSYLQALKPLDSFHSSILQAYLSFLYEKDQHYKKLIQKPSS